MTYIYFSKDATKDSTATSFKLFAGENRITIPVEVTVAGKWPDQDIEYTVSADLNETTLYPENYVIPEKFVTAPIIRLIRSLSNLSTIPIWPRKI